MGRRNVGGVPAGPPASDPHPAAEPPDAQVYAVDADLLADPWAAGFGDPNQPLNGPAGRWMLARYLVGRAIGESLSRGLLILGVVLLAGAALLGWAGSTLGAVLVGLVALGVLLIRGVVRAVLRRVGSPGVGVGGTVSGGLRALVADTRSDVLRELRRLGLPGRTVTMPLLALRLARGRTRAVTLQRLRGFDIDRVVPAARVDEWHLLLQAERGRDRSRRG
jgi:putative effector of murein hydrolase LrgA (UPF0299 family)